MKTLFGSLVYAGTRPVSEAAGSDSSEADGGIFECEMPVDKSGFVSIEAVDLAGPLGRAEEAVHVAAFDIYFERWDNEEFSNVLQLFMTGEGGSFFSLNMKYFANSSTVHVRLRNTVYSMQDSTVIKAPMKSWLRLQIEYYSKQGTARIFLNGECVGEYSTNFDLTDTALFSGLNFFATANAGFKVCLDRVVAVTVLRALGSSDPSPIVTSDFPEYRFASGALSEIDGLKLKRGTRSLITAEPSPTDPDTRVLSFDVVKNAKITVSSVAYPYSSETLVLLKPGAVWEVENPLQCYHLSFRVADEGLREELWRLPDCVEPGNAGRYRELFQKIISFSSSGRAHDVLMVESLMLELFHRLISEYGTAACEVNVADRRKAAIDAKVEAVYRYVRRNLSRRLLLEDVAAFVGYSPAYFHKIFRRATGVTLAEYIRNERLKRAVHLMATTDRTLTEIAYDCGFSSQSYFSAAFRCRFGVTPRRYLPSAGRTAKSRDAEKV